MRNEDEVVKNIIRCWYNKSQNITQQPDGVFEQFISLWIAFNAYYVATSDPLKLERMQLQRIKDSYSQPFYNITEVHADKFNEFKNYINKKSQNPGFIQDLRYEVTLSEEHKRRYLKIESLCEYLDCVYQIRCNLFHGGKDVADAQDQKLVELALSTLSIFLEEIFKREKIITSIPSIQ